VVSATRVSLPQCPFEVPVIVGPAPTSISSLGGWPLARSDAVARFHSKSKVTTPNRCQILKRSGVIMSRGTPGLLQREGDIVIIVGPFGLQAFVLLVLLAPLGGEGYGPADRL